MALSHLTSQVSIVTHRRGVSPRRNAIKAVARRYGARKGRRDECATAL